MKVLHLAAGNRWTGAAAPAFAETEALRDAGIDAHYGYVGGYKLQAKIGQLDFTHAIIAKAQNPVSFLASANAIERLLLHHHFDVIHTHLTYDHWLARFAAWDLRTPIVRTFHSRRVLRGDPFTRSLIRRSAAIFVVNDDFRSAGPVASLNPIFAPPPVNQRQFSPAGRDVRERYGIEAGIPLIVAIGKLSKDRGFEDVLKTFALVRRQLSEARLMIVGHGEHRPALETLARTLRIDDAVLWAGYHENDLAEHYRAADVLLFTARGSDEGHRAVLEAMSCGVIPITFPIEGVSALLGDLSAKCIAEEGIPERAALKVTAALGSDVAELRRRAFERSEGFGYPRAAERLVAAYEAIM